MDLEFKEHECSICFPKLPNKDEDLTAYTEVPGTDWMASACFQRAQTSARTAANARFKRGDTPEEVQAWANTHTLGRGGPRKSDAEKVMTKVDKLSPEQRAELRAMLDDEEDREAAD